MIPHKHPAWRQTGSDKNDKCSIQAVIKYVRILTVNVEVAEFLHTLKIQLSMHKLNNFNVGIKNKMFAQQT